MEIRSEERDERAGAMGQGELQEAVGVMEQGELQEAVSVMEQGELQEAVSVMEQDELHEDVSVMGQGELHVDVGGMVQAGLQETAAAAGLECAGNGVRVQRQAHAGAGREYVNEMSLTFDAVSLNESFARVVVAAFITPLNPTVEELADVKTAVSEAVTNAIIHGYDSRGGKIRMYCVVTGNLLSVRVEDDGVGIADIEQAMMPLYTSRPELERSGMGFAFMEAFMDDLKVESRPGEGTKVSMMKRVGDAIRTA